MKNDQIIKVILVLNLVTIEGKAFMISNKLSKLASLGFVRPLSSTLRAIVSASPCSQEIS
jgi:hypothetical protein